MELCLLLSIFLSTYTANGVPLATTKKAYILDAPPPAAPVVRTSYMSPLCPTKLDLVLAIDSSGSVQKTWNEIIDNAEILLANFLINPNYTRVGIIDFSAVANVFTPLDSLNTDEAAFNALETLRSRPQNGETWIELGIDRANELFGSATPLRENVRKVVVMYTDGKSTSGDEESLKALMKVQKESHIETFAVKVTKDVSETTIKLIGCDAAHVFHLVDDPGAGEKNLKDDVCGVKVKPVPSVSTSTTPTWAVTTTSSAIKPTSSGVGKENGTAVTTPTPTTKTTTEAMHGTFPPKEAASKCEEERDKALFIVNSKVPTLYPIFVPECMPDGRYKEVQHNEGTKFYWCVDEETGEVINGTKTYNDIPKCPDDEAENATRPLTKCEKEHKKALSQVHLLEDIFIPQCSLYDGLYMEIQSNPIFGGKWCVNRYTGDTINGTFLPVGEGNPVCPEKTKCETEREEAVKANYRSAGTAGFIFAHFVPQCELSGLYTKIQVESSTGYAWCVNDVTGEELNGTRKSPSEGMPVCPGEVNVDCLLPKHIGPCRAAVSKYYFNQETAMCEKFTYGGCNGNANNFDTFTECHVKCGMLTRCIIDKELAELHEPTANYTVFIPTCDEDGLFSKVQHFVNGSSWCVNQRTGNIIPDTTVDNGEAQCDTGNHTEEKHYEPTCFENAGKILNSRGDYHIGSYVPRCTQDGYYEEIQENDKDEEYWCVHKYTGIEINGTRKKTYEGKLVCPVHENKMCLLPKDPGPCYALFQRFHYDWQKKRCSRFNYGGCQGNDNNFMSLKECEETCQVTNDQKPPSGTEKPTVSTAKTVATVKTTVPVTKAPPTQIPDEVDIYNPLNPCSVEADYANQRKIKHNLTGGFVPQCESNGDYKLMQVHGGTGFRWCVDSKSGRIVEGTMTGPGKPDPECTAGNTNGQKPPSGTEKPTVSTAKTVATVKTTVPVTRAPPTQIPDEVDIYNPLNPCSVEADYANQRKIKHNLTGGFVPQCESNGDYKLMQVHGGTGFRWCVDSKSGRIVEGTMTGPGKPDPECTAGKNVSLPPTKCEDERAKALKQVHMIPDILVPICDPDDGLYSEIQYGGMVRGKWCVDRLTGETIKGTYVEEGNPTCPKNVSRPLTKCENERGEALKEIHRIPDVFVPICDLEDGLYSEIQSGGMLGGKWCVDRLTGQIINGTYVKNGDPTCHPVVEIHYDGSSETSKSNATSGSSTGDATPNGNTLSVNLTKGENHGESTLPFPEPEAPPVEADISNPQNPCLVELDFARQANLAEHRIGGFEPQCEPNGDYKEIQRHGSTGQSWCVNPKTGREVPGTRVGPGRGDPDCTGKGHDVLTPPVLTPPPPPPTTETTTALATTTVTTQSTVLATTTPTPRTLTSTQLTTTPSTTKTDSQSSSDNSLREELLKLAENCPYKIGTNLTKIGCYNDDQQIPRPLPVLLFNETSINVNVKSEWTTFVRGLVCKCAMETRKRGWFTFGIQDFGECFSGPDEGRYDEDKEAPVDMCIGEDQNDCQKDNQACAGISKKDSTSKRKMFANYVFMIKTAKHTEIERIEYDKKKRKRSAKRSERKHSRHHL